MVLNAIFNHIWVISCFIGGGNRSIQWKPSTCHRQTLSHNVLSSTPRLSGVRTHNISGDRHWLPYDHDGPLQQVSKPRKWICSSHLNLTKYKYNEQILKCISLTRCSQEYINVFKGTSYWKDEISKKIYTNFLNNPYINNTFPLFDIVSSINLKFVYFLSVYKITISCPIHTC